MNVEFCVEEIFSLGAGTNQRTAQLFGVGKKGQQKIVIGDTTGTVTCLRLVKGKASVRCCDTGKDNCFARHTKSVFAGR
jgi:hypothetical protein